MKAKQILYVIVNEKEEFLHSITNDAIFWTPLFSMAELIINLPLANNINKMASGVIYKINYSLTKIK